MGLLVKSLPPYTGPYAVSTVDLEIPVESRRSFGDAKLKSTGKPALQLDTILVTLYYPADASRLGSGERQPWFERPLGQTAAGYARFVGQRPWLMKLFVYLFAANVRLPVEADRPLACPSDSGSRRTPAVSPRSDSQETVVAGDHITGSTNGTFPVVVFSHGLSGTRTTYSQWAGDIASRGFIVAAIEHRDGSGPISTVRGKDGKQERVVDYIRPEDLTWPTGQEPLSSLEFRSVQLEMRLAEVKETLRALERLNDGEGASLAQANHRRSRKSIGDQGLAEWAGRLDLKEQITMAGHSFGGATTIQVLRAGATSFPFKRGIALDPWADPIPPAPSLADALSDSPISPTNSRPDPTTTCASKSSDSSPSLDIVTPFLVINSESFTLWKEHYKLVRGIVDAVKDKAPRWLMTMVGSIHTSFSDLPLLAPFIAKRTGARVDPQLAVSEIVEACDEFLCSAYDGRVLGQRVKEGDEAGARPGEGEKDETGRKRVMGGVPGEMRIHVRA